MVQLLTFNIHKGFSTFNNCFSLHRLLEAIHSVSADIVFLQEVVGENIKKAKKHDNWPEDSHTEFLAGTIWPYYAYSKNAVYPDGHHGNAILSKFPILLSKNFDISTNRFEKRGFLYCVLDVPDSAYPVHCLCIHLGLTSVSRKKQFRMLKKFIADEIPGDEPIILAGDFNEWGIKNRETGPISLGLKDAVMETNGKLARTFPSIVPILPLDRIWLRGMTSFHSHVYFSGFWSKLSDHAALFIEAEFHTPLRKAQ